MKAESHAPRTDTSPETREAAFYAELLDKAHTEGLKSIRTQLLAQPSEDNGRRCIMKAVVDTEKGRFEGIGDADPTNVEDFLAPHLIRVAETRAKARALRDAVNVGVVSFEELDGVSLNRDSRPESGAQARRRSRKPRSPAHARSRGNAQSRSPQAGNGSADPMSEAQRRYLFRILAGQGLQKEAAEEHLKDLFEVSALSEITKRAATKMIDELLQSAAPGNGGGGNGAASRHQR